MLDPKDLRIGNLVSCQPIGDTYTDRKPYYGECIYAVTGLRGGFVWLDIGHDAEQKVPCDHVQRIPLTEYWLKRAGYNEIYRSDFHKTYESSHGIIKLYPDGTAQYHNGNMNCGRKFKYVHEWQNIIHALTGEELNLNG